MSFDYIKFTGFQSVGADRAILLDSQNRMRTANLFPESSQDPHDKYPALYSMRDTEHDGLPSAYLIYMHAIDEYDAATKLVGSLRHWRKLLNCKWFMEGLKNKGFEGLDQWRKDMVDRDASAGKRALMKQVAKGDTSAARKILDMAKPAAAPKVGRPGTKANKDQQEKVDKEVALKVKLAKLNAAHQAEHGT